MTGKIDAVKTDMERIVEQYKQQQALHISRQNEQQQQFLELQAQLRQHQQHTAHIVAREKKSAEESANCSSQLALLRRKVTEKDREILLLEKKIAEKETEHSRRLSELESECRKEAADLLAKNENTFAVKMAIKVEEFEKNMSFLAITSDMFFSHMR